MRRVADEAMVALMVELYTRERQSIRAIAAALGVAYGTAHTALTRAGVVRPRRAHETTLPPRLINDGLINDGEERS